jgi:hypothetical protein
MDAGIRIKDAAELRAPGVNFEEDSQEPHSADEPPVLVNPVQGDPPPQPENCPAGFGRKPPGFLPVCLTCSVDDECAEATKGAVQ